MSPIRFRIHALHLISLLAVSCEKPAHETGTRPGEESAPHATKSNRPLDEDSVVTRSSLQRSMAEAAGLSAPKDREHALAAVIEEAMESDQELALEAFNLMAENRPARNRMIEHFAMRLAEQDMDGAVQWAQSLETDEERSLAFGNIALVLSDEDPEGAAKLLSDSGVSSRDFDVAVVQVIQRWAGQSPNDAAAWVIQFDPGEARTAGLKAIASAWLEQDAKAINGWISGIQDPDIRDEAVTGIAESILELPDSEQVENLRLVTSNVRLRFEKLKQEADEQ